MIGTCVTGGIVSLTSPRQTISHWWLDSSSQAWRGEVYWCLCATNRWQRGTSIMVWGAFHFRGKSELFIVEGPMNQQVYRRVLRQNLLPWSRGTSHNNSVLVQDNAPPHKARATMTFLESQDVGVMDWPAKALISTLLSISGTKWLSIFVIWITLLQHNNSCLGCPMARETEGLGEEHATTGACCSRRSWRVHTILSYYKCIQRHFQPSHQRLWWSNGNSPLYDYLYLLCVVSWYICCLVEYLVYVRKPPQ